MFDKMLNCFFYIYRKKNYVWQIVKHCFIKYKYKFYKTMIDNLSIMVFIYSDLKNSLTICQT